jgi:phage baseplate assembly protein W
MPSFDNTANDFIGKGLTFPIRLVNGKPPIDGGKILIESSLRDILAWVIGTRFFLGEYGSKLEYLLQEPDNGVSAALLRYYTVALVKFWEKRVEIVSVRIIKRKEGVMLIKLEYRITNTQITGAFIYPYYSQLIY